MKGEHNKVRKKMMGERNQPSNSVTIDANGGIFNRQTFGSNGTVI